MLVGLTLGLQFCTSQESPTMHDLNVGIAAIQGRRPSMEDRYAVRRFGQMEVYAVFDGHSGQEAAEYLKAHLLDAIEKTYTTNKANTKEDDDKLLEDALTQAFLQIDKEIIQTHPQAGSTATVVIVTPSKIVTANTGDSRAVLARTDNQVVSLSIDHKPNRKDEKARIEARGGKVMMRGVWRLDGILAVSRAFGDSRLKAHGTGLIVDPEIITVERKTSTVESDIYKEGGGNSERQRAASKEQPTAEEDFIIVASDGLWDVFTNNEAVKFVKERIIGGNMGMREIAEQLVQAAYEAYSTDNVTVLIVNLNPNAKQHSHMKKQKEEL